MDPKRRTDVGRNGAAAAAAAAENRFGLFAARAQETPKRDDRTQTRRPTMTTTISGWGGGGGFGTTGSPSDAAAQHALCAYAGAKACCMPFWAAYICRRARVFVALYKWRTFMNASRSRFFFGSATLIFCPKRCWRVNL